MVYDEIIAALEIGKNVYWKHDGYKVIEQKGKLYEIYKYNGSMCMLHESQYKDCFVGA